MAQGGAAWIEPFKEPKVWIPTVAVTTAIAVAIGMIVTAGAAGDDAAQAAIVPSASPSASATAADPEAPVSPEPSIVPSPSASPEPSGAAEVVHDEPVELVIDACVPSGATTVSATRTGAVLPGGPGASTEAADLAPRELFSSYADPAFSADGTRLALVESGEGRSTVRLLGAATMTPILNLGSASDAVAAWDPAGTRLGVARVMDDGDLEVLTASGATGATTFVTEIRDAIPQSLAWSADGACLAVALRDGATPLSAANSPASNMVAVVRVADGVTTWLGTGMSPVFAPDGTVVFTYSAGGPPALWRSSTDGLAQGLLGAAVDGVGDAVLSHDGADAAYVFHGARLDIRVIGADGVGDRSVGLINAEWARVTWAPDDATLVVVGGDNEGERSGVWTVDVASGTVSRVPLGLAEGEWVGHAAAVPGDDAVIAMVNSPRGSEQTSRPVLVAGGEAVDLAEPRAGWATCAPTWDPAGETLVMCHGTVLTADEEIDPSLVVTRR